MVQHQTDAVNCVLQNVEVSEPSRKRPDLFSPLVILKKIVKFHWSTTRKCTRARIVVVNHINSVMYSAVSFIVL